MSPVNHVIQRAFAAVFSSIGRFGFRHIRLHGLIDNAFESQTTMLCFCIPSATSRFIQAIAAAPRRRPPSAGKTTTWFVP